MGMKLKPSQDVKMVINFKPIEKTVDGKTMSLAFDEETERFDLKVDRKLVVSSCRLGDCVSRARAKGFEISDEESKVTFKAIKE